MPTTEKALETKGKLQVDFREISLTGSQIYHGSGIPDFNPDLLVSRKGLDIYTKMREDDQIKAVLMMKKFARLMTPWEIQPASQDPMDIEIAEFVKTNFDNITGTFEDILLGIFTALDYGYSISEKLWYRIDKGQFAGKIGLKGVKTREPFYYAFESDVYGNLKQDGIIYQGPTPIDLQNTTSTLTQILNKTGYGYHLPIDKFIIYSYNREFSNWYGKSDLRGAYRSWWSKEVLIRFMNIYMERFGMPTHLAKYPKNLSKPDRDALKTTLDRVQTKYSIVVPDDVSIELLSAGAGGAEGFRSAIEMHNKFISRSILVPDLMGFNEIGQGAYALGKKHFDVFLWILQKLGRDVEEAIVGEQIIKQLVDFNYSNVEKYPSFKFESITAEGTATRANIVQMGVAGGFINPEEEWIRDYLALPKSDPSKPLGLPTAPVSGVPSNIPTPPTLPSATAGKDSEGVPIEPGMSDIEMPDEGGVSIGNKGGKFSEEFRVSKEYIEAVRKWKTKKYTSNLVSISKINPNQEQNKIIDGNKVQSMVTTLQRGEALAPVEIDKNNNLINGHHRLMAYKMVGKTEIPATVADYARFADEGDTKWVTINGRAVPIKDGKPDFGGNTDFKPERKLEGTRKDKNGKGFGLGDTVKIPTGESGVLSSFVSNKFHPDYGKIKVSLGNGESRYLFNDELEVTHSKKYPDIKPKRRTFVREFQKLNGLELDKRFDYKVDYTQMKNDLDEYEAETVDNLSKIIQLQRDALLRTIERKKILEEKNYDAVNALQLRFVGDFKKELENRLIKLYLDSKLETLKEVQKGSEDRIELVTKFAADLTIQPWIPVQPTDAIDFFKRKVTAKVTDDNGAKKLLTLATRKELNYYDAKAFAIAGIEKNTILKKAKMILLNGLKLGNTPKDTMFNLGNMFDDYLTTGELQDGELVTPARLETVVRTNFSEAFNAGRNIMMNDPDIGDFVPYKQWKAILDDRVRETHAEMHNLIFKRDDPSVEGIPPAGFNCRCTWMPITKLEVQRLVDGGDGIEVSTEADFPPDFPDPGFNSYVESTKVVDTVGQEVVRCPYSSCGSSDIDVKEQDGMKLIHCNDCLNDSKMDGSSVYFFDKGVNQWIKQFTITTKINDVVRCPYPNCGESDELSILEDNKELGMKIYLCKKCSNIFKVLNTGELYLYDKGLGKWIKEDMKAKPNYITGER